MDRLQAMQVFTRVVECNGFSKAAESLGMPRATVTAMIQSLESLLGTRLLHRTTRRVSPTFDGAAYYERAVRILADVDEAEASFSTTRANPKGRLTVDMPSTIGRLIILPLLREFHQRYPQIELRLGMSDRQVDLVQEGVDCVLRVGDLPDSSLIARRIGMLPRITVATPAYLATHGEPAIPDDLLSGHQVVNYFSARTGRIVPPEFIVDGILQEVAVPGIVSVNDGDAYVAAALAGFGIIQPPLFMVVPQIKAGNLTEILADYTAPGMPLSVLYPQGRHLSAKVRVFVDWVAELFERCPLLALKGTGSQDGCLGSPSAFVRPRRPAWLGLP